MGYCTLTELKGQINKTISTDDVDLQVVIDAATRAIDRTCKRPDGFVALATAVARYYPGSGTPIQRIDECTDITLVEVKDSSSDTTYVAWAATDYTYASGDPRRPDFNRTPYTFLIVSPSGDYSVFTQGEYAHQRGFKAVEDLRFAVQTVKVTAKWGYATAVPADIKMACLMQSARWFKRMEGAMADALASGDVGMIMYTKEIDPDIAGILIRGSYVRQGVG